MLTKNDIYQKFGETAEAGQLLETELGTALLEVDLIGEDLYNKKDPEAAKEIIRKVNKKTLGQILRKLQGNLDGLDKLDDQLEKALKERNRLAHSFFREHNVRIFSPDGLEIMMKDLSSIHSCLLKAYRQVLLLTQGVDIFKQGDIPEAPDHYPI